MHFARETISKTKGSKMSEKLAKPQQAMKKKCGGPLTALFTSISMSFFQMTSELASVCSLLL